LSITIRSIHIVVRGIALLISGAVLFAFAVERCCTA